MFSEIDIEQMKHSPYMIVQLNHHDATLHSDLPGHDWIIVSRYNAADCYFLHWHSSRYPYHQRRGSYKSLEKALNYITEHEEWFIAHH